VRVTHKHGAWAVHLAYPFLKRERVSWSSLLHIWIRRIQRGAQPSNRMQYMLRAWTLKASLVECTASRTCYPTPRDCPYISSVERLS
jgi:hypothetical protein